MRTTAVVTLVVVMPAQVLAGAVLPTGAQVVTGSATVATGPNSLVINQTSSAAIVNWNTFSIGAGGSVLFNNGSGSTLSRVTGNVTSQIDGQLSATGTLYLVNPAGVVVGPGGKVTTGGSFIASTHDITDQDYLDGGSATFSGNSTASVVNNGTIASANGDVALIARRVENAGTISAPNGTAALAAGYDVLMSDNSGENGKFAVRVGGSDTAVVNSGTVKAAEIEMRANGGNVYALAGNTEAVIKATGVSSSGGRIFLTAENGGKVKSTAHIVARAPTVTVLPIPRPADLDGGKVVVTGGTVDLAGTVDASAEGEGTSGGSIIAVASGQGIYSGDLLAQGGTGGVGGTVETSGHSVDFTGISVNTSAVGGTTGNWLVDPEDLTVDAASAATISSNLATTSVTLQTTSTTASGTGVVTAGGNGDITIASAISWSSGNRLTLDAYNNIAIDAAITGTSGGLTLTAGNAISASAGISIGSYLQTAGAFSQIAATLPTFSATDFAINGGSFLRVTGGDGTAATPYQIADVYGLQGVGSSSAYRAAKWALANNIDASGTAHWNSGAGFVPIGNAANAFTGTFNGQDHTITGLTIDRPTTTNVGLFGAVGIKDGNSSATWVKNLGLIDVDITGLSKVGGITGGLSYAQLGNDYVTGTVTGDATVDSQYVGGLAGVASVSGVYASYSEANVSGGTDVGGLIGYAISGLVQTSYATGNVSGTNRVGGLIGQNRTTLRNSYALGDVSGTSYVGGLVGYNHADGYIQATYASGAVNGTSNVGGLVGANYNVVFDSYYDIDTTGQSVGIGSYANDASFNVAVGLTTAQARTASSYSAFSFGNSGIWFMIDGQTRPFLRSEYSTTITNAHQLQLMAMDVSADYTLANDIDASATSGSNASGMWADSGFMPIGTLARSFSGSFDGAYHTISGLTINRPSSDRVGLFGYSYGATATRVGLTNVNITGKNMVGALGGQFSGQVTDSFATGHVSGGWQVGGLLGEADDLSVAGYLNTRLYANVAVTASGGEGGGLIGQNNVPLTQAYSAGYLSGSAIKVGGAIGYNFSAATLTNVYYDSLTTGASSGPTTPQTTTQLQAALPSGFDPNWAIVAGKSYAYLKGFYSDGTPVVVSGTAYSSSSTALAGVTVSAVSGGSHVGSISTGANGYYNILAPSGSLSATGVLTYLDDASEQGVSFTDNVTPSAGQTGLNLTGGDFVIRTQGSALSDTLSSLQGTLGSFGDSDLGTISVAGGSLTASLDINLYAIGSTPYALDGNVISTGGGLYLQSVGSSFSLTGVRSLSARSNLTLASSASWSDSSTLSLSSSVGNISLKSVTGASGSLTLAAAGRVYPLGDVTVGSFTLSSGIWTQVGNAQPALSAADFGVSSGATFIRALAGSGTSADPYQLFDVYGLQGMGSSSLLSKSFVLANDIDASGTASWNSGAGFASIGSATIDFSGTLNGQSHTITGLTISRATIDNVGLFGVTASSASISNVGLVGGSITGQTNVGALVGYNLAKLTNVYASGNVSGTTYVGGLVGSNASAISASYATGMVKGTNYLGGLVGGNFAAGTIGTSFATGAVGGAGSSNVGGLVGLNNGTIVNAYATGSATGNFYVGGLVGQNNNGAVTNAYATGAVTGSSLTGGLVGVNAGSGSVTASFYDRTTSGQSDAGKGTGLTSAEMTDASSYTGWDMAINGGSSSVWRIYDGYTAPLLRTFLTATTVTATDVSKTYDGTTYAGGFTASYSDPSAVLFGTLGGNLASVKNAGTYAIGGLYSDQFGYDIAMSGSLTVNKASLTVTANSASKTYDGLAYSGGNGVTYAGLVNGETASVLGGTLAYGGTAGGAVNAGSYSITASGLISGNYDISYVAGALTVNKAALTVTANSASKTYDGLAYSGGNGVTYAGLVNGETASVLGGTLAYGGTADGAVNAGSYTLTTSGLTSGNYDISYVAGALTVNKASLTVTANSAAKTYDGLAYSGGNGVTYAGLVNGETASVLDGTLSYGGTAQGAINAGSYTLTASGLTSGNYDISYVAGALTVNKASLTVTANSASKTYDGLGYVAGSAGVTYAGLVNGETASVLDGTLSYDGTAQGAVNAGSYSITASGLTSGNYDISYVAGALTVNKAALTITANSASKTYDGLGYVAGSAGVSYAGLVNGETASVLSGTLTYGGTADGAVNAGSYSITASGLTSGNYDISYVAGALTVNKAALTITANSASKTYDGLGYVAGSAGVTYAGLVNGETASVLDGTLSYGGTADGAVNAGSYSITASGLTSGNYDISYVAGALTVNKAALTITANSASKTYDGLGYVAGSAGVSYAGLVNGETASVLDGTLSYGGTADGAVNAGSYSITASGLTSGNYDISYVAGALTVNKAALTITANSASKTYDGLGYVAGSAGVSYAGLVNGETASVLDGTLSYGGTAQGAVNAGSYSITASGLTSGNYDISYVAGALTVNKAALTITANSASKTYDGLGYVAGSAGVTYAGLVNGETASVLDGTLSYGGTSQGAVNAGSYSITASGLTSGNYDISYVAGALTINPAALTLVIQPAAVSKTYGQLAALSAYSVLGTLQGSDAIGSVTLSSAGAAANANVGSYDITASNAVFSSGSASNYTITYQTLSNGLTVTPAVLTASLTGSIAKTYDGTASATLGSGNYMLSSLAVAGDLVSLVAPTSGSYDSADAGSGKTVSVSGLSLSGASAGNYVLASDSISGTIGTVNKASLTITANSASKTYDGLGYVAGSAGVSYAGLVNGETASVLDGTLSYGGTAQGAVNAGSYSITASGLTSGNYDISYVAGALTVNKAALTITANSASKTYDGLGYVAGSAGVTYAGLVNGETASVLDGTLSYGGTAQGAINAGSYSIAASGLTSGNYDISYVAGALTVNKAALTITANSASKTYDGLGYVAGSAGVTYAGLVNGETASVLGGTLTYGGTAQGAVNAGSYSITASGLTSGNYDISYVAGALTINPAALTLVIQPAAVSKTYGQLAALSAYSVLGTLQGGDAIGSVTLSSAGAAATANVGSYDITASNAVFSSGSASNYTITYQTLSNGLTVTPAVLTASLTGSIAKTYDGTASATLGSGNYTLSSLAVAGDLVSLVAPTSGSYDSADAGTSKMVSVSGLTLSGASAGNYVLASDSISGTIGAVNKAALTITANSASKTYDGLGYVAGSAGVTYAGLVNGETASVLDGTLSYGGTSQGAVNAGSYSITASGLTSGNYDISYVAGALTVNKAALTVTANSASKTYDGLAYSGGNGVTYAGLVNGETASVLGGTLAYGGTADGAVNAGSYSITASGLTSGNYDISYVAGALTVNKAALTITANSASKTYDGLGYVAGSAGVTYAGLVNGETASVLDGTLSYGGTAQGAVNAGSYSITASGLTSGNYDISYVAGALTVNKAALTITANSASKTYDGLGYVAGSAGVSYAGLVNGETASVLGGTLTYGGTADGAVNAGSYTITASGLTSGNYDISYVAGALTINPAALTLVIQPAAVSKTYGQLAALSAYSVLGTLQGGDAIGSVTLSSAGAAATANVGSYDITASNAVFSSGSASNYTITYQTLSNGLTVTPAVLTASLTGSIAKTYDGTASATLGSGNYMLSSLAVAGDLVSLVTPTSGSYDTANAGSGKTVSVSGLSLSGASAGNYVLASDSISGTIGAVNKAALTITANSASKTYDGLAYSGGNGVTYAGLVNGETASVLSGTLTYGGTADGAVNAGSYTLTASGLTSGNYDISYVAGALTVNKASLTVTTNNAAKTYDGLAYSGGNGVTYAGLVNGETASVLGGTLAYGGTADGAVNAGSYSITASGLTSGNYDISYVAGALTVNKAALTITANSASKTYDGLGYVAGSAGVSYAGLVNGETASVLDGTLSYGGTAQGAVNAGSYSITASGLTSGNYDISYVAGALTVNKASLTITANSASKTYDGLGYVAGSAGVTYAGLVNGETASVLDGTLSYGGTSQGAVNAGSYSITASGLTSGNYDISYVAGELTINPVTLAVGLFADASQPDHNAFAQGRISPTPGTTLSFVLSETSAQLRTASVSPAPNVAFDNSVYDTYNMRTGAVSSDSMPDDAASQANTGTRTLVFAPGTFAILGVFADDGDGEASAASSLAEPACSVGVAGAASAGMPYPCNVASDGG